MAMYETIKNPIQKSGRIVSTQIWTMFVCIEVALRGDAQGIGRSNLAKGRDPSGSWVQYPNPAVSLIPRHSRWAVLVHWCALSGPTLI